MSTIRRVMYWVSTCVAVLGISRSVQADILPVDNADFDKVAVAPGGYTYAIEAWQTNNEGGGPPAWISNGYYADESTPVNPAIYSTQDEVFQDLTVTFAEGVTYTFSMDIGNRADDNYIWRVFFYNATDGSYTSAVSEATGTVVGSPAGSDPWLGGEAVVQYTATAADEGDTIGIGFGGLTSSYYTLYDHASVLSSASGTAPTITSDPQDQTFILGDPDAEPAFTVSAVGSTPLTYQWRFDGASLPGATNQVLTLTGADAADVGAYDVVVGNAFGSVLSQSAMLGLTLANIEPIDQSVFFGSVATFSMPLPGTGYAYQWMFNGGDIVGAVDGTLELGGAILSDIGDYRVKVTLGGNTLTSEVAFLDVTIPPVEPAAKVALVTDTVTFSLPEQALGATYQWKQDGVILAGQNAASLTLSSLAPSDTGNYAVDITLSGETVTTAPANLTVADWPTLPYATVIADDGPIVHWRLGESTGAITAVDEIGFFDADYRFDVVLEDTGAPLGDADTSAFFPGTQDSKVDAYPLDVVDINPPEFSVDFWVMPTGGSGFRSPITSRDFFDATEIHGWTFYADDNNLWQFRIGRGQVSEGSAWNIIQGPAVINNQWTHLVGTYDGTDMRFYVNGALVGTLANVDYSPQDFNPLWIGAGSTEDVTDIGEFFWVGRVDEVALYDRALTSQEIIDHYAAAFPASASPQLLSDSMDLLRLPTEHATFSVAVHSSPPVTYQWQLGGVDIAGATHSTLTLTNVQAADAGMYRAKISNSSGSIFSSEAVLEICSGSCAVAVPNGGFDDASGVLADLWNDLGGSVRGGNEGGNGWTADYYTGGFPTDATFATTVAPGPFRQDLAGRTWVAGATYTLTVDLFASDTYENSFDDAINWRIALTASGETLAADVWYSDEFQTAGEAVPPGRLINIVQDGGPSLTSATLVYTATAADAGKALGIELGGDVTLGGTQGDDYYGHMDNVRLTAEAATATAILSIEWIGGNMVLRWDASGTLQETDALPGSWSDVPGATSPVVVIPITPQTYFRLRD